MPAFDFPNNPAVGDEADNGGRIYQWDGVKWVFVGLSGSDLDNLIAGTCIGLVTSPGPPQTVTVNVNRGCVQSPWVGNVDAAGGALINLTALGVGSANPQYPLDVTGNARVTGCVYLGGALPLVSLCNDGSGNLLINGSPITNVLSNLLAGTCITLTPGAGTVTISANVGCILGGLLAGTCMTLTPGAGTVTVSANVACIQSPWVQNIDGGGHSLSNVSQVSVSGNVNIGGCYQIMGVNFACGNGAGGINLTNIVTINGSPVPTPVGPAPPNTSVQFNSNGAFGGSGALIWTGSALGITGQAIVGQINTDNPLILANAPGVYDTLGVLVGGGIVARTAGGFAMFDSNEQGDFNVGRDLYINGRVFATSAYFGPTRTLSCPELFCTNDQDPSPNQDPETLTHYVRTSDATLVFTFRDRFGNVSRGTVQLG